MRAKAPLIIGISGGSASGKTTFAESLSRVLGEDLCAILYQDNYYFDQSARFDGDGRSVNYDHPDSIDFELMARHLRDLQNGFSVEVPQYDFKSHTRLAQTVPFAARPVILVDGILILSQSRIRECLDAKVFIRTSEDLRFLRRLARDVALRGRTEEGVRSQFLAHVKPMHDLFVDPSQVHADRIYSGEIDFTGAVEDLLAFLRDRVRRDAVLTPD